MNAYLWTSVVLCGLSAIGRIGRIVKQDHTRTPQMEAIDGICDVALMAWAIGLLARSA